MTDLLSRIRIYAAEVMGGEASWWDPERVLYWSKYAASLKFASEDEARAFVKRKLELAENTGIAPYGSDKIDNIAKMTPVYRIGSYFKIGRRVGNVTRLTWKDIHVTPEPYTYVVNVALAYSTEDFTVGKPIEYVPYSKLLPFADHDTLYNTGEEKLRIERLASAIKRGRKFTAIVISRERSGFVLQEGQHRARACRLLRLRTVPCKVITYHE